MNGIPPAQSLTAAKAPDPQAELRRLAREMEGVFYKQLFDAMRKSVPESGLIGSSLGQEVFTSLLDEKIASVAAERAQHGLSEALYRQLSKHLEDVDAKNPGIASSVDPEAGPEGSPTTSSGALSMAGIQRVTPDTRSR